MLGLVWSVSAKFSCFLFGWNVPLGWYRLPVGRVGARLSRGLGTATHEKQTYLNRQSDKTSAQLA